jgi:hypothetical protein
VLQLFSTKSFRAHLRAFVVTFVRISIFIDAFARSFVHQVAAIDRPATIAQHNRDTHPISFAAVAFRIASP